MDAQKHHSELEPLLAESKWLRRLARGLVHRDADADDVAQETWLAVLQGRGRVSSPRGWMERVTRRSASRQRRSSRRRKDHEALVEPSGVEARSPAETAERLELAQLLAEALRALPEPYRGALYHHYYDGESASTIARREGVPAGTVRWRLAHGRGLLRERLRAHDGRTWDHWAVTLAPLTGAGSHTVSAAATFTSLGIIMNIKATIVGICAGALTAGGVSLVEAPAARAQAKTGPASQVAAQAPQTTAATGESIRSTPTPSASIRTAGAAAGADALFGIVAFGQVTDPAGLPMPAVRMQLQSSSGSREQTTTDDRGGWSLMGIEPGEYEVTLSKSGSITTSEAVSIPDTRSWRHDFTLVDAMSIPVRFETAEGEALAVGRPFAVAGYLGVAATLKSPPARMRVRGRVLSSSESGRFLSRAERATPPDLPARYQGLLQLTAETPLWASLVYRDVVLESRLLAGNEDELVFIVPDLASLSGTVRVRVVDLDTGEPLTEGVLLRHSSGGLQVSPRVEDGALLFDDVPPGTMDLVSRSSKHERLERAVKIAPGTELDIGTLTLGSRAAFEVRAVDPSGEPSHATVSAVRPDLVAGLLDLDLRISSRADGDGVTQITWLALGPTLIRAGGRDGHGLVALEVDTRETQSFEMTVPVGVDAVIKGLTLDEGEFWVLEDAVGAPLRCSDGSPGTLCLAPGTYTLRVLSGDVERSRQQFTVDSSSTDIDLGKN